MAFATLCFLGVQGTATIPEFEKLDDILKKVKDEDKQRVRDLIRVKDNILKLESEMKNTSNMTKEVEAFDFNLNVLRNSAASVKENLQTLGYRQKRRVRPELEVNTNDWYLARLARIEETCETLNSEKDSLRERLTDIDENFLTELAGLISRFKRIETDAAGFNPSQKRASAEGFASLNRLRQDDVTLGDLTNIIRPALLKMEARLEKVNSTKLAVEAAITGFDERSGEYESALKSMGTELEGMENIVKEEKTRRAPASSTQG